MSDDIQNQEALKDYCLSKYEELRDKLFVFTISERGAGKKKKRRGIIWKIIKKL